MKNQIIQKRLNQLVEKKRILLTLKKDKRGNELKVTNEMIARLRRWDKEIQIKEKKEKSKESMKNLKTTFKAFGKAIEKAGNEMSEGMKRFREASRMEVPTFCESIKYNVTKSE